MLPEWLTTFFGWFTPAYWDAMGHPQAWASIIGRLVAALATVLGVLIAAYLTYRYALKKERITHNTEVHVDRLKREIAALESAWTLLAYMSQRKNQHAIVHWEMQRGEGGKKDKRYFYHFENLERYCLTAHSDVVYAQHAGLFISKDIRDRVNGFRALVGTLYMDHLRTNPAVTDSGLYPIRKKEQAEKMAQCFDDINAALRQELEQRYKALEV